MAAPSSKGTRKPSPPEALSSRQAAQPEYVKLSVTGPIQQFLRRR